VVAQEAARLWADHADTSVPPPLLSSFELDALAAARAAQPQLPGALLLEAWDPGWLEYARSLGCAAVIVDYQMLDAASIGRIHAAGMRSLCYTVNEPAAARELIAWGIDGIITDAVDRFTPAGTPTAGCT
jgi:glycerophosphoryl diester phosphodiesterase